MARVEPLCSNFLANIPDRVLGGKGKRDWLK